MAVKLRIIGLPNEVDLFMKKISACSCMAITMESRDYPNRNSSYVRRYTDIELTSDKCCPMLGVGSVVKILDLDSLQSSKLPSFFDAPAGHTRQGIADLLYDKEAHDD